ncbi:unnamed protein product [Phaedon cochleariae]|uniref:Nose resistant-to-fluoxetine protein N-terminal domain-containing protein n=1 Tax=Phaedon cochleariae TaxID=80249 RepID=A0A9P0DPE8_PHACE|nr:unnamed protein product [Phaedon cochleariae]
MPKMKCFTALCLLLLQHVVLGDIVSTLKSHLSVSVSSECSNALDLYLENLYHAPGDDNWALKMLDASSKLPTGLLSYNFGEMGDFEECLATESLDHSIQPRYCLGGFSTSSFQKIYEQNSSDHEKILQQMNIKTRLRNLLTPTLNDNNEEENRAARMITGPSWAVCLPKNCSQTDINQIFSKLSVEFTCQTREDLDIPLTSGAITTIVSFVVVICIMIASTSYDIYCNSTTRVPPNPVLISFSIYTNGSKLFKMGKSSEFSSIYGIRVISMMWVIFGHTFLDAISGPTTNLKAVIEWCKQLASMVAISGTLAVDTFFVIGGIVLAYTFMKMKHNGMEFKICQFYIHRYVRLTPPLAAMVLVTATLSSYFGSGPHWSSVKMVLEDACKKDWWTALLYTQNYYHVSSNSMCIGQSWYLDVDMQLFILSPLVLLPLWYYPTIGQCLLYGYIGATIITNFCIGYINDLSALLTAQIITPTIGGGDMMSILYMKTHARATPWLMGISVGYYLSLINFKNKTVPRLRREVVLVVWAVFLAVILTCVFGGHSTLMGPEYDRWGNSLHIALVRPAWALCVAWVIVACYLDYGGPINTFLSLPIFQVLSRFTFSIYLIHLNLIYYRSFSYKTGTHFSFFDMTCQFWVYLIYSFGLSIFWTLAFESPFIALEKLLLT